MPFLSPMLAKPLPKDFSLSPGEFSAETKIDGHRLIVEVADGSSNLFTDKSVTAWSRNGLLRALPTHLLESLSLFPNGMYDGELCVPGKRSYGVTELVNGPDLVYCIFDLLSIHGADTTPLSYNNRRGFLTDVFSKQTSESVHLEKSTPVDSWEQVITLRDEVWERDGEGLILKRRNSPYLVGKRSKDQIKIKALRTEILTVIGFVPSHGLINNRGLYATIVIQNEDGIVTTVKTRNDAECRALEAEGNVELEWRETRFMGKPMKMIVNHPAVGRKLQIEFQELTIPDNNYRHPRFDHWI